MDELLDITESLPGPKPSYFFKGNEKFKALEEKVNVIKTCCKSIAENYIKIGFELKEIKERELYKTAVNGYYSVYQDIETFALKVFGFSRTTTYNLLGVVDEFCDIDKRTLKSFYIDYSYSKLVEMLPLPYMQYKTIDSTATVSEIRELKKIWDKYGFDDKQTWKEALRKGREKMAEEVNAECTAKSQQKITGLLSLLNASPETGETVTAEATEQQAEPGRLPLLFKNDTERKAFLSAKNCEKWPLYVDVPKLGLQFRRYEFANGDSLIAQFAHSYAWDNKYTGSFRLHLQTKDKPEFDCTGLAETYVLEYMKSHKDEL